MDEIRSLTAMEPVAAASVPEYDEDLIYDALIAAEGAVAPGSLSGKKVVIKPNFVAKRTPDEAATVHPAVLGAVIRWLRFHGAENITIAESPGGVYNPTRLHGVYAATGAREIAEKYGVTLNDDCSFSETPFPGGVICRLFDIITPILEADVIVDVCKLKTHALTGMSAAVKNVFGVIPGIVKFEMHSRYPDYDDFAEMLVDLCELLCRRAEFFSVTDGIISMEGNGPTSGTPRKLGALLVSRNPFASDAVAAHLIGRDGKIPTVNISADRGFCSESVSDADVRPIGVPSADSLAVGDFAQPDSIDKNGIEIMRNLFGGSIYKLFRPYPVIDYSTCVGCGECARSCPRHTIKMTPVKDAGKSARRAQVMTVPVIARDGCIRCFCCQELCPHGVVMIKKNPITRILS